MEQVTTHMLCLDVPSFFVVSTAQSWPHWHEGTSSEPAAAGAGGFAYAADAGAEYPAGGFAYEGGAGFANAGAGAGFAKGAGLPNEGFA